MPPRRLSVTLSYLDVIESGRLYLVKQLGTGFLFFSRRYAEPVTVADLAEVLMLSEKQTEREVRRRTGLPFRRTLLHFRMSAADSLLSSTACSKNEIAERVGYRSYSGFWKAYRAYQKSK